MILRVLAQETEKKNKVEFLSLAGKMGKRPNSKSLVGQAKTVGTDPEDNLETSA